MQLQIASEFLGQEDTKEIYGKLALRMENTNEYEDAAKVRNF